MLCRCVAEFVEGVAGSQASQGCGQAGGVLVVRHGGLWWPNSKSAGSGCEWRGHMECRTTLVPGGCWWWVCLGYVR